MGQPMSEAILAKLACHPDVVCVTDQHIVLRDLSIRDPSEFVAEKRRVLVIAKLLVCHCGRLDKPGHHEARRGYFKVFANGRESLFEGEPRYCPRGQWQVEEVIPWEIAVKHEALMRSAGAVESRPLVSRIFSRKDC